MKKETLDAGPFYHGTKADLQVGDILVSGRQSNYNEHVIMNHIYFTATKDIAGLAAVVANGEKKPRVYEVEPLGDFENDPNVTDKKFPGNPTRSYRSVDGLKVVGEVFDWNEPAPDYLAAILKLKEEMNKPEKAHLILN